MGLLGEYGKKHPVAQKGDLVDLEDEEIIMYAGDILQTEYVTDKDIDFPLVRELLHETLYMKEEYPFFVLHYIRFEDRKVTVQYSVAPVGEKGNPGPIVIGIGIKKLVLWLLALLGGILAVYLIAIAAHRGIILRRPPPMGDAVITARDSKTLWGIPDVTIYVDGQSVGKTGPGGSIKVTDLLAGIHTFAGETIDGYWPPDTIKQAVIENQIVNIEITYHPDDEPLPTVGRLEVYTHPFDAKVSVGGEDMGLAPIILELERGEYAVTYAYVEGYVTPKPDIATIVGNTTTVLIGYYTEPLYEDDVWGRFLQYALIGGAVVIGGVVVVPEVIRAARRPAK